jgi:hypothetical protein
MTNVGTETEPEPYSYLELETEHVEGGALIYVRYPRSDS